MNPNSKGMLAGCPNCGGTLRLDEDRYGRRLACFSCWWQHDLLAPAPETLALLVKIDGHRPTGNSHNLGGAKQTDGKPENGSKFYYRQRYLGRPRKFDTSPKDA